MPFPLARHSDSSLVRVRPGPPRRHGRLWTHAEQLVRPWCRDSGIRFDHDTETVVGIGLETISRTGLSAAGFGERSCTLLLRRSSAKGLPPVVRGRDQTVSTEESPERPSRASRRRANTPQPRDSRTAITCPGWELRWMVAQMQQPALCRGDGGKRRCAARHETLPTNSGMRTITRRSSAMRPGRC